ncbi:MAG TPA: septum formation protein Maf [Porphyromonadaceae bacterium]|nr:septum formation protein Maf [Porphyromonadaceae bacterium]
MKNLDKYNIILASNSPRRKELLSGLDLQFTVNVMADIDESYPDTLAPSMVPVYLAEKKAAAYMHALKENDLLITADTVVCTETEILGKPACKDEAVEMLRKLSGKEHQVVTGVAIVSLGKTESFASVTSVLFDVLTDEEIDYYVEKYCPYDKAGSYGIQEWIGYIGVKSIKGSYFNVMGLPVQKLYRVLCDY